MEIAIDTPAPDLVRHLIDAHEVISSLKFIEYPPAPTFEDIAKGQALSFQQSLDRRLRHGGKKTVEHRLSRLELKSHALCRLIESLSSGMALALNSEVELDAEKTAHIPMVDFLCAQSVTALRDLSVAMQRIEPSGGFILHSANSYHYYGKSLLTKVEWHQFVGKCLLLEPLVDVRYFGHCLIDGFAALRISRQSMLSSSFPSVVATL